jgi:hypothetical protein
VDAQSKLCDGFVTTVCPSVGESSQAGSAAKEFPSASVLGHGGRLSAVIKKRI